MKRVVIVLMLVSFNVKAQQSSIINLDSIRAFVRKDSLRKEGLKKSFLRENWDTKNFNLYKNEFTEFPFQIRFDDVFYASPILKDNVITSRYGWRWGRAHRGVDIDLISGDDVMAMLDGKVRYVGYHSGHGKTVVIRHFNGLETVYAHLSKYKVKVNEIVNKGQVIGKGGKTGNARGSHVHLETLYKGNHINPEYLFSFDDKHKIKKTFFWITQDWVTPYFHNSKRPSEFVYFNTLEEAKNSKGLEQKIHLVKRGDTLYDISRKYNISISRICKVNFINRDNTLKIGQELVLGD